MAELSNVVVFNKSLWKAPKVRRVSLSRWPRVSLIKKSPVLNGQAITEETKLFLRNIEFLKKWPIHLLEGKEEVCSLHYFDRGDVIVDNSSKSQWIFIVKNGSVSVLQKIPEVKNPENAEVISSPKKESSQQSCMNPDERHRTVYRYTKGKKSSPASIDIQKIKFYKHLGVEKMHGGGKEFCLTTSALNVRKKFSKEQQTLTGTEASTSHRTFKGKLLKNREACENHKIKPEKDCSINETNIGSGPIFLLIQILERGQNFDPFDPSDLSSYVKLIGTLTSNIRWKVRRIEGILQSILKGVNRLVFDDQPILSVVSNGAECIRLSKGFYLQHTNEYNIESIKRTEYPYVSLQKMQENLQDYMKWLSYKTAIYREKVQMIETKRQKRKDCLPQYTGQYSYRTGPR